MSLPPFKTILEAEFRNFEQSRVIFEDIVTWGERLKEILNVRHIEETEGAIELCMLTHIICNAFITSLLLVMKCHVFHAYTVARLGVEAFFQMVIIELDFENNLKVWKDFNYLKANSEEWKKAKVVYDEVFRKKRRKYDYSTIIDIQERDEIVKRWNTLCEIGSHVNFIQTLFSFNVNETPDEIEIISGIFDVSNTEQNHIGKYLIWMIDTYYLIAKSISKIIENHGLSLWFSSDRISSSWSEWIDFKIQKAKALGIEGAPI